MLKLSAPENAAAYSCSLQLTRIRLRSCYSTKAVVRHTVEALGLSKFGGWECARGTKREMGNCCFPGPVCLAVLRPGADFARPSTRK